jgi:hypothetical protein
MDGAGRRAQPCGFGGLCGQVSIFAYGREKAMTPTFAVGDHVSWNSEAGLVTGFIRKVHRENLTWKGYIHHASRDEPQYEIKSDRSNHIALHKASALKRVRS